jgi:hypothetical protein
MLYDTAMLIFVSAATLGHFDTHDGSNKHLKLPVCHSFKEKQTKLIKYFLELYLSTS